MSELSDALSQFQRQIVDVEAKRSTALHRIQENILSTENDRAQRINRAIAKIKSGSELVAEGCDELNEIENDSARKSQEVVTDISVERRRLEAPRPSLRSVGAK